MRRIAAVVAMMVAATMAPAVAHAKCMYPRPFVSPDSGATLPPNPVLYLFVPGTMTPDAGEDAEVVSVDLSADGSAVASQVELVSRAPAFWTYRVTVARATPAGLKLKVTFAQDPERTLEASYTIGEASPAVQKPSRLMGRPWRESYFWMCSHQSTWNIPLAVEAPAYRVEWAYSLSDYETGPRAKVVFPRNLTSFFSWDDSPELPPSIVELGYVSCLGRNVSWASRRRIWAGVWALQADGTEVALNDAPLVLLKP